MDTEIWCGLVYDLMTFKKNKPLKQQQERKNINVDTIFVRISQVLLPECTQLLILILAVKKSETQRDTMPYESIPPK